MGRERTEGQGSFTLVELIVVVAVLTVLALLIVYGCPRAREQARRIRCANNLSAWGKGMKMYSMDHYEMFPNDIHSSMGSPGRYCDNAKVFICPSSGMMPTDEVVNMTAQFCSYNLVRNQKESDTATWMQACDKDGGANVSPTRFGGNHGGRGGNVLYIDGSVDFVPTRVWLTNWAAIVGTNIDWTKDIAGD